MQEASILLVCSSSLVQCGIYVEKSLIKKYESRQKTLDALLELWIEIKKHYQVRAIFYARGPNSLSALKLLHIFVHTLKNLTNLELFAVDHFYFNKQRPIRAFGSQFFIKKDGEISLENRECEILNDFMLPEKLQQEDFNQECVPLYIVPPI
ncbi:hypothetical protein [Helicobacter anatolicus]|uniref:hypothetical protein n=1 Tax=Helicobacter anatolicus TaxID=2905874 RepID=UPI001E5ABD90|nr:hypothetical protein [Helicobacter anatolicus]MCE3038578.1 hypothetical protein [Helicobacter anatolicus]